MIRLLVVGDTLLDRDVEGTVQRVCPDAPAPVLDVQAVRERPGGAGLAAVLAARPQASVTLATALGGDEAGRRVRHLLAGVVQLHELLRLPATPAKTRLRAQGQSLARVDDAGHLLGPDPAGAAPGRPTSGAPAGDAADAAVDVSADDAVDEQALTALVLASDAVLVADYGGPVSRHPVVREVLRRHAHTVPVVWDPHPRGAGPVPGVRVATPNHGEARAFAAALPQAPAADAPLTDVAARLATHWGAAAVTVTDGPRGAVTVDGPDPAYRRAAAPCPSTVDTCGAGDRFAGALALALAAGTALPDAVATATRDAGAWLAAGGVGGGLPLAGALLDTAPAAGTADEVRARVRAQGGTLVATGGCFDVLHAGHLALLEAARQMGDALVVLLNSDASVRRLKGASRPVNGAGDRARMLEALQCVDAVVVFEDDDPRATLERLRPDVWVKGGDYQAHDLPEAPVVTAGGGRVVTVPLVPGRSTTSVLQRWSAAGRGEVRTA